MKAYTYVRQGEFQLLEKENMCILASMYAQVHKCLNIYNKLIQPSPSM